MATVSEPGGDYNPYEPPAAPDALAGDPDVISDADLPQASRGSRWAARFIDQAMLGTILVVAALFSPLKLKYGWIEMFTSGSTETTVLGLVALGFWLFQSYLLATTGQTLGKRWVKIKVVRMNGDPPGFVFAVLLREWVLFGAAWIPTIGYFVGLVDALFIFGAEERCLHDYIAGTRVVAVLRG